VIRVVLSREDSCPQYGQGAAGATEELFERFKKGNAAGDSIGIGLAIVRQICELSQFDIVYIYNGGWHGLAISFLPRVPASKLLQNLSLPLQQA